MLNDTEFSRKIYKELCEEFGDNFLEQPEESVFERAITAKDIVKYSSEEIDAIQKEYDKENCREIFRPMSSTASIRKRCCFCSIITATA